MRGTHRILTTRSKPAIPVFHRFVADERGATAIEYGLIVSLIFLAVVAAIQAFTNSTSDMYSGIASSMN